MSTSMIVLVAGATGMQGGAVVQALLRRGYQVRALTRRPSSAAAARLREQLVDVVGGDFADPEPLARAMRGVDALFAMTTPSEQGVVGELEQGVALVNAAAAARVGHVVLSSMASADRATGIPHFDSKRAVEKYLAASGLPYSIIGPVFFMENLLAPWTVDDLGQGRLALALPAGRSLQQIAVADVGGFAASLIERRRAVFGRRFDIAGDELTGEQAAVILGDVVGRRIRYHAFSPSVLREGSEDTARMFEWFARSGHTADIEGLRDDFPEVGWRDFESWARQQDWGILGPGEQLASRA